MQNLVNLLKTRTVIFAIILVILPWLVDTVVVHDLLTRLSHSSSTTPQATTQPVIGTSIWILIKLLALICGVIIIYMSYQTAPTEPPKQE